MYAIILCSYTWIFLYLDINNVEEANMKKIGLCLSGGGAKGAYQVGAVKALDDLGIFAKISAFSGTSIGSVNTVMITSTSIDYAKDLWLNISENPLESTSTLREKIKVSKFKLIQNGLYSMDSLDQLLKEHIIFDHLKQKEVYITVSEIGEENKGFFELFKSTYKHFVRHDSKVQYIPLSKLSDSDMIEAVKASCSIPIVFPAVISDNKKYYDGGIFDTTPIHPLAEALCDLVILINISFESRFNLPKRHYSNVKIIEIRPSDDMGKVLDFTNQHSKHLYDMGYQDTITFFKDDEVLALFK